MSSAAYILVIAIQLLKGSWLSQKEKEPIDQKPPPMPEAMRALAVRSQKLTQVKPTKELQKDPLKMFLRRPSFLFRPMLLYN